MAWDNTGSQSALQHEFRTPWPRGAVGVTRAQPGTAAGLCVLWARHSSWSAHLVSGTDLLFDLDRVQVPVSESGWDMDPDWETENCTKGLLQAFCPCLPSPRRQLWSAISGQTGHLKPGG